MTDTPISNQWLNGYDDNEMTLDAHSIMCRLEAKLAAVTEQRDRLAKALEECKEDSIELLGERSWWKDEPRSDYKKRYEETSENITRADKILAIVKGISNE
jgi:hypothetical protein